MRPQVIGELFDGPLDVIGDVHGELYALESLLKRMGYDERGRHPEGRRLVFVGDLIDRGQDSPGVLRLVAKMVAQGNAQCVVGNHELNALRNDPEEGRSGEGWWYGRTEEKYESVVVDEDSKQREFLPFLQSLPVALDGERLRVVHACWDEDRVAQLKGEERVIDVFYRYDDEMGPTLKELREHAHREYMAAGFNLRDRTANPPYLEAVAAYDEMNQMANPVRVLTSGIERAAGRAFHASGKWRMVERVPWWDEHQGPPVVFGHYWRRYGGSKPPEEKVDADLFGDTPPDTWLGAAMCIDYSVGYRFADRPKKIQPSKSAFCLAALRIPEWTLVFDDGRAPFDLGPPPTER